MKTFEERYTAWIDGQLAGPALTSFELELSRRAAAGEARADKTDADRLHQLLTSHLRAPAMTNTEFFSHQLRERIEADRRTDERRRESPRAGRRPLFAWSFGQLAGLGGAFVFVAAALYYGLMPTQPVSTDGGPRLVQQPAANVAPATNDPTAREPSPVVPAQRGPAGDMQLAKASPTPPPIDAAAPADIEKVQVTDQAKPTTATPLHYQKPDVNVIWINGLDYLKDVPSDSPAAGTPAATAQP